MFVVTLIFPILAFLSVRVIPAKYYVRSLAVGVLVVLAYGQGFLLHSDFFGLLGPFPESPGEAAMAQTASSTWDPRFRTLFVPNDGSFYFHPTIFDFYFESGDESQVRFLPRVTMAAGSKWTPYDGAQVELKALDELVPAGADPGCNICYCKWRGFSTSSSIRLVCRAPACGSMTITREATSKPRCVAPAWHRSSNPSTIARSGVLLVPSPEYMRRTVFLAYRRKPLPTTY